MRRLLEQLDGVTAHLRASTMPGGPSSTRVIYLMTGFSGLFAATLLTLCFCWVYVTYRVANIEFAGATSSLWLVAYSFVTSAQKRKNTDEKELALSTRPPNG